MSPDDPSKQQSESESSGPPAALPVPVAALSIKDEIDVTSWTGTYWRILAPKWAHQPLSGAGSALYGGRWNPKGTPALYVSENFETAFMEYEQDLGTRPGTFCAYKVNCEDIADLTDPNTQRALTCNDDVLFCKWKQILLVQKEAPPTWSVVQILIQQGFVGARVPSARRPGGVNLVLWRWNHTPRHQIEVIDLKLDLPRNQKSWQPDDPTS